MAVANKPAIIEERGREGNKLRVAEISIATYSEPIRLCCVLYAQAERLNSTMSSIECIGR